MRSNESALFTATAIPAGMMAVAITVWFAWAERGQIAPVWLPLALAVLFAVLSYDLSFSTLGPGRLSLELAYFIAATLALPFPSALIVGAGSAVIGSLLRVQHGLPRTRFAAVTGANAAIGVMMAGASAAAFARLAPLLAGSSSLLLEFLLLASALFLVMNLTNLIAMMGWVILRHESPLAWAKHFLRTTLPGEAVTVPFGGLLALELRSEGGEVGFILLAAIGLFVSFLLKTISDSEQKLRAMNQQLEDRVGELATLNAIGREIASSLDPSRVFTIIRRECRKVFHPDFFFIARIDYETREVHVEHSMAGDVPARTTLFPLGQGLTSHVVTTEKPLLIEDAPRDLRLKAIKPIVVEPDIRSILAVPLFVENRVVGVLSVQCFREKAFEERHIALLTTIGQQAAVALENARHYQMATVDYLTGLYQRDYFLQRLGDEHRRATRYGSTFSLLMLDLDSFKRINDRFGHFAGDRFLKAVGATVHGLLRASDIPCRYGGEEFCILLPETDLAGARTIAERIRGEIAAVKVAEGPHMLSTTVSVGVSSFPVHYEGNLAGLLQKADQALYAAKKQGKNRVVSAAT